jgi:hypothetical protein
MLRLMGRKQRWRFSLQITEGPNAAKATSSTTCSPTSTSANWYARRSRTLITTAADPCPTQRAEPTPLPRHRENQGDTPSVCPALGVMQALVRRTDASRGDAANRPKAVWRGTCERCPATPLQSG